jgi:hypothetical protein
LPLSRSSWFPDAEAHQKVESHAIVEVLETGIGSRF